MKTGGLVRNVDKHGRIVLPIEMRRGLGWEDNSLIEINPFGRYLLLKKQNDTVPKGEFSAQASPVRAEITALLNQLNEEDLLLTLEVLQRLCAAPKGKAQDENATGSVNSFYCQQDV